MVEVSAGIIICDSKILCFQRGENKYPYISRKWEFPGGKVEKGEDPKDTIIRELSEELKIDISHEKIKHLCTTEHDYPDFHIIMHSFLIPTTNVHYTLTEHIRAEWHTIDELKDIDWAEADKDVVKAIEKYYGQ